MSVALNHQHDDNPTAKHASVSNHLYGWSISIWCVCVCVCTRLNQYENHRTASGYTNSLIWKRFIFRFINSYNSLFYILFVERFGLSFDTCDNADPNDPTDGCIFAFQTQLFTVFATQIMLNNLFEWIGPAWRQRAAERNQNNLLAQLQADLQADSGRAPARTSDEKSDPTKSEKDLWDHQDISGDGDGGVGISQPELEFHKSALESTMSDYDDLVVTYGYSVMFAVALPIAPLLALVANFLETKLDSNKYLNVCQRPVPKSAAHIGTWFAIIELMSMISVATNLAILLFVSHAGERLVEDLSTRFILFIACEHVMMVTKLLMAFFIPDEPYWFHEHIRRQAHVTSILIDDKTEKIESEVVLNPNETVFKMHKLQKTSHHKELVAEHLPRPKPFDRLEGQQRFKGVLTAAQHHHPFS